VVLLSNPATPRNTTGKAFRITAEAPMTGGHDPAGLVQRKLGKGHIRNMLELASSPVSEPRSAGAATGFEPDELLRRVAESGDRAAFERLFAYFAPRVKAFLMKGGAARDVAEDLAQEAMVKVWRKAKLFDPAKASASTWIYAIARNLRIDALRRNAKPALDPDEPSLAAEEAPTADEEYYRKDRDARIRKIFAALPPNQREVVSLHFFDDASHSAIAERLNIPLGTVKSRLRLAFARIRREVEDLR
jgi:RNA polymerase sigma-70 factor (ECF subfamily)